MTDLVALIQNRVALKKRGSEWVGLCPFHNEKTPSFTVVPAKGFFHCFGCGAHGDAAGFVMRIEGMSFREAKGKLSTDSYRPSVRKRVNTANPRAAADDDEDKRRRAFELWRASRHAAWTPVEIYLRGRGIDVDAIGGVPPTLRYCPAAFHKATGLHLPAMLAAIVDGAGRFLTVHRTYLTADGRGKAGVAAPKMVMGSYSGGAIRLTRGPAPGLDPGVLAVGEGIETCLAVLQAERLAGRDTAVWAGVALGNIAGGGVQERRPARHPASPRCALGAAGRRDKFLPSPVPDMARPGVLLPAGCREIVLLADADSDRPTTERLLARAARRFEAEGRRVRIAWPPDGMDFNDWLRTDAPAEGAAA